MMKGIQLFRPQNDYTNYQMANIEGEKKSKKRRKRGDSENFIEDYFALQSVDSFKNLNLFDDENEEKLVCNPNFNRIDVFAFLYL